MNREKIKIIIEELISRPLERENELLGSGILDSMMTMMLVGRLEEEFSVIFDPGDFTHHNFNSVEAIEKLVDAYLKPDSVKGIYGAAQMRTDRRGYTP